MQKPLILIALLLSWGIPSSVADTADAVQKSGVERKITQTSLNTQHERGIAVRFPNDEGIENDPDVLVAVNFEDEHWKDVLSAAGSPERIFVVTPDDSVASFKALQRRAIAIKVERGNYYGGSLDYFFAKHQEGTEPEAIYFRYYLRFGEDWDGRGGKLPGFGGTYNRAGWGGKPSDGTNGWSARGTFSRADHQKVRIGTYCYHAEMTSQYGSVWFWSRDGLGLLDRNRWYCIEQYLRLNSPHSRDGIIRAWINGKLAFEKLDIRFRNTRALRIEKIWFNVFHGGKDTAVSDDHLFIDNIVIANAFIGPLALTQ